MGRQGRFVARDAGARLVLGVLLLEDEEALTAAVVGDKKNPVERRCTSLACILLRHSMIVSVSSGAIPPHSTSALECAIRRFFTGQHDWHAIRRHQR